MKKSSNKYIKKWNTIFNILALQFWWSNLNLLTALGTLLGSLYLDSARPYLTLRSCIIPSSCSSASRSSALQRSLFSSSYCWSWTFGCSRNCWARCLIFSFFIRLFSRYRYALRIFALLGVAPVDVPTWMASSSSMTTSQQSSSHLFLIRSQILSQNFNSTHWFVATFYDWRHHLVN